MTTHTVTLVLALLFGGAATAISASAAPASGHWEGTIKLPSVELEIRVDLAADPSTHAWSGTIDIPAQMIRGFALGSVEVDGVRVGFRMPDIPGDPVFHGTIEDDGKHISGTFQQSGGSYPFALERRASTARAGETPSRGLPGEGIIGHWQGSLRVGPAELRLVLHATAAEGGGFTATIDSIDQGAKGIRCRA